MGLTLTTVLMPCVITGKVTGTEKMEVRLLAPLGVEDNTEVAGVEGNGCITGDAVTSPLGSVLI